MKTWVLYYSRGGNTKKIAEAIAEELEILKTEQVPPAYPPENVQLLFLGTGVYAGKPDPKMIEFIRTLNTDRVKNVAVFGTRGGNDTRAIETVKSLIKEKGINVIDETFSCQGKYFIFFNRKKPDAEDLKAAKAFARKIYDSLKA
ncbi:nitric oxide synthase [Ruminiclostridium herbifermentans]|uniref:Nitric oxide synthase n=1 Tax=Ruminiclostridium herbifermentans TaxID=2488810 RepID=A0A4U7JF77_9FIRM|nr:flavodoxin family protein [Ruminiclostridium herbifermentans]QNU68048.1 nitric oxide synthase [Ruminiclostridium herbifermentans]